MRAERIILTCAAILAIASSFPATALHSAEQAPVEPDASAIFMIPQKDIQINALLERTVDSLHDAFRHVGRLLPVERSAARKTLEGTEAPGTEAHYRNAAGKLGVKVYLVVMAGRSGDTFYGHVKLIPLSEEYAPLRRDFTVRSRVLLNIPLKLDRLIVKHLRDLKLSVPVGPDRDGLRTIGAGQWHGLVPGPCRLVSGEEIRIVECGRYHSIASFPPSFGSRSRTAIDRVPETFRYLRNLDRDIELNIYRRYGLRENQLKGADPEKKMAEAIMVVNPGANLLIPGYGTYLSTGYLGFKDSSPSIPGVILTTSLMVTHFTLPEFMTNFKINFAPWVRDRDKTLAMRDFQIFLWATFPVTVATGFMDQLAHQFILKETLPPFFLNKDEAALAFSVIIPGGGMFYKGYRFFGWGFYGAEMCLAGFAVYHRRDKKKSTTLFLALGSLKISEMIVSYIVPPGYQFYRLEKESEASIPSLSFGLNYDDSGIPAVAFSATMKF